MHMRGRWNRWLFRVFCLLGFLSVYAVTPKPTGRDNGVVYAGSGDATAPRAVQIERSTGQDPAKIVRVMIGNREVKPGVTFQSGDEWFKDLSVVIRNLSSKKIVFARVQVYFPETGDGTPERPRVGDQSSVGQIPENGRYSGVTGQKLEDAPRDPIVVEPGQELTVPVISHFGDDHFDNVKSSIESRQPLSSIATCVVGLATLYFDDGTKWAAGHYYRPDPNTPGKHIIISYEEFNGQPATK
jgi:hypothetical protein